LGRLLLYQLPWLPPRISDPRFEASQTAPFGREAARGDFTGTAIFREFTRKVLEKLGVPENTVEATVQPGEPHSSEWATF